MDQVCLHNSLKTCRRKLGLTQDHLALILNRKSGARISLLEQGRKRPTAEECLVFQKLFQRSVAEIWPRWTVTIERRANVRIRKLVVQLGSREYRSVRHSQRAKYVTEQLAVVLKKHSQN